MPNMSYCRFENTLRDLQDCKEALDEQGVERIVASDYEKPNVRKLIELCKDIVDSHDEEW
jgi:hypothetical protein